MLNETEPTVVKFRSAAREVDTLLGPLEVLPLPLHLKRLESRLDQSPSYRSGTDLCLDDRAFFLRGFLQWLKPGGHMSEIFDRFKTHCHNVDEFLKKCERATKETTELRHLKVYRDHNRDRIDLLELMARNGNQGEIISEILRRLEDVA